MSECAVCLAADNANPANLQALVRYQAAKLDRLTQADAFALVAAQARIAELEGIVGRLNDRIAGRQRKAAS